MAGGLANLQNDLPKIPHHLLKSRAERVARGGEHDLLAQVTLADGRGEVRTGG